MMRPVPRHPTTTVTMAKVNQMIDDNWSRAVEDGINNGYLDEESEAYKHLMRLISARQVLTML